MQSNDTNFPVPGTSEEATELINLLEKLDSYANTLVEGGEVDDGEIIEVFCKAFELASGCKPTEFQINDFLIGFKDGAKEYRESNIDMSPDISVN